MKQFWRGFLKESTLKVNFKVMIYHKLWKTSKLLQNLQVLWQYLRVKILAAGEHIFKLLAQYSEVLRQYPRILYLQVNTFFKYWLNTCEYYHNNYEYCHNTCEYWVGEYTLGMFCLYATKLWMMSCNIHRFCLWDTLSTREYAMYHHEGENCRNKLAKSDTCKW